MDDELCDLVTPGVAIVLFCGSYHGDHAVYIIDFAMGGGGQGAFTNDGCTAEMAVAQGAEGGLVFELAGGGVLTTDDTVGVCA